jgi:hypothetical protein
LLHSHDASDGYSARCQKHELGTEMIPTTSLESGCHADTAAVSADYAGAGWVSLAQKSPARRVIHNLEYLGRIWENYRFHRRAQIALLRIRPCASETAASPINVRTATLRLDTSTTPRCIDRFQYSSSWVVQLTITGQALETCPIHITARLTLPCCRHAIFEFGTEPH